MTMGSLMLAWLLAASPTSGEVYYINQHQLRIPITVDQARRSEIKELILYMSADEGKTWNEQAVASPDQDAFPFYAPKDGTYWFSVCVVSPQGKREPPDIYNVAPSQRIVIDTLKPLVRIKSTERQGEDVVVNWEIQEDHPDWATLKLEYRSADAPANQWMPVPLSPATSGQTRFRPTSATALALRLQMQDLAGNGSTAEGEVAANLAAALPPSSSPQLPSPTPAVQNIPAIVPPAQGTTGQATGTTVPATAWQNTNPPKPFAAAANEAKPGFEVPPPMAPFNSQPTTNLPGTDLGSRLVASSDSAATASPSATGVTSPRPMPRGSLPPLQIVNNRQISLDYEVTKVGPSGIDKVELWMTRDDGKTWERFAENRTPKPPLTVDLPGEGVYGFRLVLSSKAGRSQLPPTNNTLPEVRVELDTTPPTAQLFRPEPDPRQSDTLILTWNATDRNMAPNPITLQWAEQPGREWQTIIADHPNDGRYSWKLPPQIPFQVYLRLITKDSAGNTSIAETPEPVCIDLTEPVGHIRGLAGAMPRTGATAAETTSSLSVPR